MTFADVCTIALSLPGVTEHIVLGGTTLKVGKKFLACMAKIDPLDTLVLKMPDQFQRQILLQNQPEIYYSTPHYEDFNSILIRLSQISESELRDVLTTCWRQLAPRKL